MTGFDAMRRAPKKRAGVGRILGAAALLALVAGCSSTPDWANPVEWYRGASDAIFGAGDSESADAGKNGKAGDDSKAKDEQAEKEKATPGAEKPFPNLASVPERPETESPEQRETMASSLVADREHARYTKEEIKRQSPSGAEAPAPSAETSSQTASAGESGGSMSAGAGEGGSAQSTAQTSAQTSTQTSAAAPSAMASGAGSGARQAEAGMQSAPQSAPRSAPPPPAMASNGGTASSSGSSASGAVSPEAEIGPNPPSRPPRFAPPPPSPAKVPQLRTGRRSPGTVSVARVGNPRFGPPPADIAAAENAGGAPGGMQGDMQGGMQSVASLPQPAGTAGAGTGVSGERAAIIRFGAGSADLSADDRRRIRIVARLYEKRGGAIRVEGHASSRTHDMKPVDHDLVNFDISLRRANAVARELTRDGVPESAIFVAAMSDSRPIYYEVMPAGDAGNQRVEIYFIN